MNKLFTVINLAIISGAQAFDYIGKDPEPKDAQAFGLIVAGSSPAAAFSGPFAEPTRAIAPGFLGNGFLAVDAEKRVWRVTCRHVLGHWSETVLGADIVGFRLNDAPANVPEIGEYRDDYNVTIAGWVPEDGALRWRVTDARSRRIPRYRAAELQEEMAKKYGQLSAGSAKPRFPDTENVRIAEISAIGDQPRMSHGTSGSAVYQRGKIVGVILAGPDGHSLISDGIYFEILRQPK